MIRPMGHPIETRAPDGRRVLIYAYVPKTEQHRGARTTDPAVEAAIKGLDESGRWHWIRDEVLWQDAALLSEDGQLGVVFNEVADPDNPAFHLSCWVRTTLSAATVGTATDSLGRQARLSRRAWEFWIRGSGRDPKGEREPEKFDDPGAWKDKIAPGDEDDQRRYVWLNEEREVFVD